MKVEERFYNVSSQGDTVNFYTCKTCSVAVMRQDREGHNDWHNEREAPAARSTSTSDKIFRQELRAELSEIVKMDFISLGDRYGTYGWRDVLLRYLEATPD